MGRVAVVVAVLMGAVDAGASPGHELEIGAALAHISGGSCDDGAHNVGSCDGGWAPSLQLEAGQNWHPAYEVSFVTREMLGASHVPGGPPDLPAFRSRRSGTLLRGYFGVGVRTRLSDALYVEVTGGSDLQLGDTGTGDGGMATGANLALAPRFGIQGDRWALVLESIVVPAAFGHVGLSDFDFTVLASRALGD